MIIQWRRRRSPGWPRLLVGWLARGLALARVAVEVAAQALRGHRARRANAGRGGRGERGGGKRTGLPLPRAEVK